MLDDQSLQLAWKRSVISRYTLMLSLYFAYFNLGRIHMYFCVFASLMTRATLSRGHITPSAAGWLPRSAPPGVLDAAAGAASGAVARGMPFAAGAASAPAAAERDARSGLGLVDRGGIVVEATLRGCLPSADGRHSKIW